MSVIAFEKIKRSPLIFSGVVLLLVLVIVGVAVGAHFGEKAAADASARAAYSWRATGEYGECKPSGDGFSQERPLSCVWNENGGESDHSDDATAAVVDDDNCSFLERPNTESRMCAFEWSQTCDNECTFVLQNSVNSGTGLAAGCGLRVKACAVECKGSDNAVHEESLCALMPRPDAVKPCTPVFCEYVVDTIGDCDAVCGIGKHEITYMCPYAPEHCAPEKKPTEYKSCTKCDGCEWSVDEFGACDTMCGFGSKAAPYKCDAPDVCGCPGTQPPDAVEECNSCDGCDWVPIQGDCDSTCGNGQLLTTYVCPLADDDVCGPQPCGPDTLRPLDTYEPCRECGECQYEPVEGSCNATCGAGAKSVTHTCPQSVIDGGCNCAGDPPADTQLPCHDCSGCSWSYTSLYGACSNGCGKGVETRVQHCNALDDAAKRYCTEQDCGSRLSTQTRSCKTCSRCSNTFLTVACDIL